MKLEKKHPLAIRWNHWINFPVLTIMIWSGLMIYWANAVYLLPRSWLGALDLGQRLGEGISWHFAFALIFVVNGVCYFSFLLLSGQWRYLWPDRRTFKDAALVGLHDLKIYKGPLPPQRKYNGAQRLAYTGVGALGILATLTGFAIYKPTQLSWLVNILGGFPAAKLEHFILTVLFVLFFLVHIVQVLRAGWNNFQAMVTGLEKKNVE